MEVEPSHAINPGPTISPDQSNIPIGATRMIALDNTTYIVFPPATPEGAEQQTIGQLTGRPHATPQQELFNSTSPDYRSTAIIGASFSTEHYEED